MTFANEVLKAYNLHYKLYLSLYIMAMLLMGNVAVSIVVCKKQSTGAALWVSYLKLTN
jgi:hypothetical protein